MSELPDAPKPAELLEHAHYLRALARRLVRDDAEADDLVQETWLEAMRQRPTPIERLRPWLAGVLRNLARERARGAGRRTRREREVAQPDESESTGSMLERLEHFRVLARDVIELEEPYRTTVVELYFEGLSAQEIADRDGVPAATVRSRHMRALQKLRERLDRRYGTREHWQLLFAPLADVRPLPPRAWHAGKLALGGLVLVAVTGAWLALRPRAAPEEPRDVAVSPAAPPRDDRAPSTDMPPAETRDALGVLPAAPAPGAAIVRRPIALTLRDEHTGEVVPEFTVELRGGADEPGRVFETLVSDANGALTSREPYPAGAYELHLVDEPRLAAWRERPRARRVVPWKVWWTHAADDERRPLDVEIGPTYTLTNAGGTDVELARIDELVALVAASLDGVPQETRAPLRVTDGIAWVRFSNEVRALPRDVPWTLELRAPGRTARANVDAFEGRARDRVVCRWAETGELALSAHDARGPVAARFTLVPLAGGDPGEGSGAESGQLAEGAHVARLGTGVWRVRVWSRRHAAVEREVDVRAGAALVLDLALERSPGAGAIAGTVSLPPGIAADDVRVFLCEPATDERTSVALTPDAHDAANASFRFDDVPAGEYVVCARARQLHVWRPGVVRVKPPAQDVHLAGELGDDAGKLVVQAVDAESGERLWHFGADVEVEPGVDQGPVHEALATSTGSVHVLLVPRGARFTWTVSAEGYRSARGDERSAVDRGDPRTVVVPLARGWASEIDVVDAAGAPVANAVVLLDGVERGRTDERGRVWVEARSAPRELVVHTPSARARVPEPRAGRDHARVRVQLGRAEADGAVRTSIR